MAFYCLCPAGNELIGNFSVSVRNVKLTLKEMSNFVGNQALGGLMVMDMSSLGYFIVGAAHDFWMKCLHRCIIFLQMFPGT